MKQKATRNDQSRSEQRPEKHRGTLAMAVLRRLSPTAQFFINVADSDFLNFSGESLQGWGYCVFAETG